MRRTALILSAVAVLGVCPPVSPAPAGAATTDATVRVLEVSPSVPPNTTDVTPLTVTLSITNTTTAPMTQLRFDIVREPPLSSSSALQKELANPVEGKNQPFRLPPVAIDGELAPRETRTVTVPLSTSTDSTAAGTLCLCRTGVYPLDFALHAAGGSVSGTPERGWAQTYIPSTGEAQTAVSWLWPFVDRPHRLTSDTTFLDDDLAASVVSGGRLDRALASLEQASSLSRVTLVVDPDLLDELIVMTQGYRVEAPSGGSRTGTGGKAAQLWLDRFKTVLASVAGYSLTPYGDPDVDALTRAGLSWSSTLPTAMAQRLLGTLGITDHHALAWPVAQSITSAALTKLVTAGASGIVLDDASMPDSAESSGGHVQLPGSSASALVESRVISKQVDAVVNRGAGGKSALPALVSSTLMPALEESNNFAVLAPDRLVDPEPSAAAAAISQTTSGPFLPTAATAALTTIDSYPGGNLAEPKNPDAEVPASQLSDAQSALTTIQTVSSALLPTDAPSVLVGYPEAVQRAAASAWRTDPAGGRSYTAALVAGAQTMSNGVRILPPANGSYSLASNDSPLLLIVQNSLTVPISVRVAVKTVGDVTGFQADSSDVESIPAGQQRTVHVQAHVARSGHFVVSAALTSPSGAPLGQPARLSIYSRALGTIGVVITVVAGSVLAIALLIRFTGRFRRLRNRRKVTASGVVDE